MGIESGFDLLEFGADAAAPYLANRDPGAGVSDVEPDKNIYFEIVDDDNDVDEAETTVHVRRDTGEPLVLAYDFATGFQNGYTGSVVEDTTVGGQKYYKVTVIPPTDWDVRATVTVGVVAKDVVGNTLNASYVFSIITANVMTTFSWSFTTADETAPTIAAWAPTGINIPVDQDVYFEVTDTASGVDLATLDVTIDGVPAVVNGVAQGGYTLATPGIANGYAVTVGHPDLDPLKVINVLVEVDDVAGNPASQGWSYTTVDDVAPVVTNNTPTGLTVPTTSFIAFDITDVGAGLNSDDITVTINSVTALSGGTFQGGYAGGSSAITPIAGGFHVVLDPDPNLSVLVDYDVDVDAQDLATVPNVMTTFSWSFRTEDVVGPVVTNNTPTGTGVDEFTLVEFDITDDGAGVDPTSVVVSIGGVLAYDGGGTGFQTNYQGLGSDVTVIPNGYHVAIDYEGEYSGLTLYGVLVDAQDLASVPNVMPQFSWDFTIRNTDPDSPVFFNKDPYDGESNVAVSNNVSFDISDVTGADQATLQLSINNVPVIVDGVEADGYSVTITGPTTLLNVVIDPDEDFRLDTVHIIEAEISDTIGNSGSDTWLFTTIQGLIQSPVLHAMASDSLIRLNWTLPPPEQMLQEVFQLRRSTVDFPIQPTEGDLVYEGNLYSFDDTDVVNGTTYYYTIFVVRKYVSGQPVYVDYEPQASAGGRPRVVNTVSIRYQEYVPVRGDFGVRTVNPLPQSRTLSVWGRRRSSDLVRTTSGKPVLSPARGLVRDIRVAAGQSAAQALKVVEVETASGLVLSLNGVIPLASLAKGQNVEAGQAIGRAVSGTVEFEIYKLPVTNFGRRTVRPRYFYLTVEERDGRTS